MKKTPKPHRAEPNTLPLLTTGKESFIINGMKLMQALSHLTYVVLLTIPATQCAHALEAVVQGGAGVNGAAVESGIGNVNARADALQANQSALNALVNQHSSLINSLISKTEDLQTQINEIRLCTDKMCTLPPTSKTCALPWGSFLNEGDSITAYSAQQSACNASCTTLAETRTCTNGVLSGSFTNQTCTAATSCPIKCGEMIQMRTCSGYGHTVETAPGTFESKESCKAWCETKLSGTCCVWSSWFKRCNVGQDIPPVLANGNIYAQQTAWAAACSK